jgi:hypothetical protein
VWLIGHGAAARARDDRCPRPCRPSLTGRADGDAPAINSARRPRNAPTLEARTTTSPRTWAGIVRRSSRAVAPMINSRGPVTDAEAVDQRGRLLIAGYAVKCVSASLSPRDRRESGRAVPRGAHQLARRSPRAPARVKPTGRAARETLGVLGRNGEAPSDRSLGASIYGPSPLVGDERKMAPQAEPHASVLRVSSRDRFADSHRPRKPFAMRTQQVERGGLGRLRRFAASRDDCGGRP